MHDWKHGPLAALLLLAGHAQADKEWRACVGEQALPPFNFVDDRHGDGRVVGVSADLLADIAKRQQHALLIARLPWPRCVAYVKTGHMDIALDAHTAQVKAAGFSGSRPYFTPHPYFFFLVNKTQFRPGMAQPAWKLVRHTVCGLSGVPYAAMGLSQQQIDAGALTHRQLLAKLRAGRCDVFVEYREIAAGLFLQDDSLHAILQSPDIAYAPLLTSAPQGLHFLTANSVQGRQLATLLDQGIEAAERKGQIAALVQTYLSGDWPGPTR